MPGKHVRFSDDTKTYVPGNSTPSPSWSDSSLPSTSGLLTPPSHKSYAPTSLPMISITVNPIIGLNINPRGHSAPLEWDLTQNPDSAIYSGTSEPLSQKTLASPATQPPLPYVTLLHPHLPWPIQVVPLRGAIVTVSDVLITLYRGLRLNVTDGEYYSHINASRVNVAYHNRVRRIKDSRQHEEERRKGVKRVDFLLENAKWVGLSSTKQGPTVWMVNTCPW